MSNSRATKRRTLREARQRSAREKNLALRHRWYAGGVAGVLAGALVFGGMSPAMADDAAPSPGIEQPAAPEENEGTEAALDAPAPSPSEAAPEAPAPAPVETSSPSAEPSPTPDGAAVAPNEPSPEATAEPSDIPPDVTSPETPVEPRAVQAPAAEDLVIAPMAANDIGQNGVGTAPAPSSTQVAITVQAAGPRATNGTIAPLAGARYGAYRGSNVTATPPAADQMVGTCTTDATGRCYMLLPRAGANTTNQSYVVSQISAPAGYRVLPELNYSTNGTSVADSLLPYRFRTGSSYNNQASSRTFVFPRPQGQDLETYRTTSGWWANALENPTVPARCGLDVAILVDLSSSVEGNEHNSRAAATGIINALTGTPSRVALHTFASSTPAAPTNTNANVPLTSVATSTSAAPLLARADGLRISDNIQYTNWDTGLYDLTRYSGLHAVIMITDGLPTRYRSESGVARTRLIEMENAIASANAVKADGAAIIAVGVGVGVDGGDANLAAISGPTRGTDYYQTGWQQLAAEMTALANQNCEGTVNVVKEVIPVGGGTPATTSAWPFAASATAATVRLENAAGAFATTASGVTGATGVLGFRSNFTGTTAADRKMRITETLTGAQANFDIVPWATGAHTAGDYARCTTTDAPNTPLNIDNYSSGSTYGFSVDPISNKTISCTVRNQAEERTAQLRVDKIWKIDANNDGVFEEITEPNAAPESISFLAARLQLAGNAGLPGGTKQFGTVYSNLALDSTVEISETVTGLPLMCTNEATFSPALTDGKTTLTKGTSEGINVVTLTNTVTCETRLTLEKSVSDGKTPVSEWMLDAHAPENALAGPEGTSGISAEVTPGVVYPLSEEALTPAARTYTQRWNPSLQTQWEANFAGGATGSWHCVPATSVNDQGAPQWGSDRRDGLNGGVSVPLGSWYKCTATNDPQPTLTLIKKLTLNGETQVVPQGTGDWTLHAAGTPFPSGGPDSEDEGSITPIPGERTGTVSGLGGFGPTRVEPGNYVLTETGERAGHTNGTAYSCVVGDEPAVTYSVGSAIQLLSGDAAVCTIINTANAPQLKLVKNVDNKGGLGSTPASAWTLSAAGTGGFTDMPTTAVDDSTATAATQWMTVRSGTAYTLGESEIAGYEAGSWSCDKDVTVTDGKITLAAGAKVTCEITNTLITHTVDLVKAWNNAFVGDTADIAVAAPSTRDDAESAATSRTLHTDTENVASIEVATGTEVTIGEILGENNRGSYAASFMCDPQVTLSGAGLERTFTATTDISCVVKNTARVADVTLTKAWAGEAFTGDTAAIQIGFPEDDGATQDAVSTSPTAETISAQARIGDTVVLEEMLGNSNAGMYSPSWSCDPAEAAPAAGELTTGDLTVTAAGIDCTVTNEVNAHEVSVTKVWVDAVEGDSATIWVTDEEGVSVATGADGSVTDSENTVTAAVRVGESVNFGETLTAPSGATYSSQLRCAPDSVSVEVINLEGTFTMPGSDVSCTITNENTSGQLTLVKQVVNDHGGTAEPDEWMLRATHASGSNGIEGHTATDSVTDRWVPAGLYTLTELGGPEGYDLTDLSCTVNGEGVELEEFLGGELDRRMTAEPVPAIRVGAQDDVVCTFVNTDVAPKLTLVKNVAGDDGTGIYEASDWDLSVGAGATWNSATSGTTMRAATETQTVRAGQPYTLSEEGPGGYLAGAWSCDGGLLQGVTLTLSLGSNVTCDITNTFVPGEMDILKEAGLPVQRADGMWEITYTITATNESRTAALAYDLVDEPRFGNGIDVVSGSWTGPDGASGTVAAGAASFPLAENVTLQPETDETQPLAQHVYTVTLVADVTTLAIEDGTTSCESEGRRAFMNSVTLAWNDTSVQDDDCEAPGFPSLTKTEIAPEQNADGSWAVGFTLTLTADSRLATVATLTDAMPAAPAGWSIAGAEWTVTPVDSGAAFTAAAGTDAEIWSGTLEAGQERSFAVTATLVPTSSSTPQVCTDEGGGIANVATLTSGHYSEDAEACTSVEAPEVTIEKTWISSALQADGSWKVTYEVVVTNPSELTAVYTATDELTFGAGASVLTERSGWTGATTGSFGSDVEATLATDRALAAGAQDTYTVTAYATVPADVYVDENAGCGDGEDAVFRNVAEAVAGGTVVSDEDCDAPTAPELTKTGTSVVQVTGKPNQFDVTYLLSVTAAEHDGFYDLVDEPDFADGIETVSGTVTQVQPTTGEPISVTAGEVFAEDVAIAAGEDHEWEITWRVTLTSAYSEEDASCGEEPGSGLFNSATLTWGGAPIEDADCIPVTERVYPTVNKDATAIEQDPATGIWTVTYDIVVALAENEAGLAAEYDLTDSVELPEGISFLGASWAGQSSGTFSGLTATLGEDVAISAGAEHTYTVTVTGELALGEDGTVGEDTLTCGLSYGGFYNEAELSSGGRTVTDDDCVDLQVPTVHKSDLDRPAAPTRAEATEIVATASTRHTVSYLVEVVAPAPTEGDPIGNLGYSIREMPAPLPSGVSLVGEWTAEAVSPDSLPVTQPTWDGAGEWLVVENGQFTSAERTEGAVVHTYVISAELEVTALPEEPLEPCRDGQGGIALWNTVEIAIGDYINTDETCAVVHLDDVDIEKTSELPGGLSSVEANDVFDYIITVTNVGTRTAMDVRVTDDDFHERLTILDLEVGDDVPWREAPGYSDGDVDLTLDYLEVGQSVDIRVAVRLEPTELPDIERLAIDDPAPVAADPLELLENTACVNLYGQVECADHEIPVREITGTVFSRCVNDAPFLGWSLRKSAALAEQPMNMLWTPVDATAATDPAQVAASAGPEVFSWANEVQWPGAAFTPDRISIRWPGWRVLEASDMTADGTGYFHPGTTSVMTAEEELQFVFNGQILDMTKQDFAWRGMTEVAFSVNPELAFQIGYPPAVAECAQARESDVRIEKTASAEKVTRGVPFSYTLDVHNADDAGAAEAVVVTDEIPETLRVTSVTWEGKDDSTVFPNWRDCAVSGASAAGFGGTLTCTLFGPLQPAGFERDTAPRITLTAEAAVTAPGGEITNVAVVDYHSFGDPDDKGRDADDAVVALDNLPPTAPPGLPATGGTLAFWIPLLALLTVGTGVVLIRVRRRGEGASRQV